LSQFLRTSAKESGIFPDISKKLQNNDYLIVTKVFPAAVPTFALQEHLICDDSNKQKIS